MLKGHLPRVIYHRVHSNVRRKSPAFFRIASSFPQPQLPPAKLLTSAPVSMSQIVTSWPHLPLTTRFPFGEKDTSLLPSVRFHEGPVAGHSGSGVSEWSRFQNPGSYLQLQRPVLLCPIVITCRAPHLQNSGHNQSALSGGVPPQSTSRFCGWSRVQKLLPEQVRLRVCDCQKMSA